MAGRKMCYKGKVGEADRTAGNAGPMMRHLHDLRQLHELWHTACSRITAGPRAAARASAEILLRNNPPPRTGTMYGPMSLPTTRCYGDTKQQSLSRGVSSVHSIGEGSPQATMLPCTSTTLCLVRPTLSPSPLHSPVCRRAVCCVGRAHCSAWAPSLQ